MRSKIAAELLHEHECIDRLTIEVYRDLLKEFTSDPSVLSSDADSGEIMWAIKEFGSVSNEVHIQTEISTLNAILE